MVLEQAVGGQCFGVVPSPSATYVLLCKRVNNFSKVGSGSVISRLCRCTSVCEDVSIHIGSPKKDICTNVTVFGTLETDSTSVAVCVSNVTTDVTDIVTLYKGPMCVDRCTHLVLRGPCKKYCNGGRRVGTITRRLRTLRSALTSVCTSGAKGAHRRVGSTCFSKGSR